MTLAAYSVVGLGKLGASIAAAIASRGFRVIGVDVDERAVQLVNSGRAPVYETDLEHTIAESRRRLRATTSHREAVVASDVTFVVVPTPSDERGAFRIDHVAAAFREIGCALAEKDVYHLVVLTSTVLPGATRYGLVPVLEEASGKRCGDDFGLCYSPEFVALGSVIRDFLNPDFLLVGELDERSGSELEAFYAAVVGREVPCARMSLENAELAKLAVNAFVTTKITFANTLAALCERMPGGDVDAVTSALGLDRRIGRAYLTGGLGFGGPCFPRDNVALAFLARALGTSALLSETTDKANRALVDGLVGRLRPLLRRETRVAVLGLAYKPGSNVVEASQALELAQRLARLGARVVAWDPLAGEAARAELDGRVLVAGSLAECLADAELVLIATPDPVFREAVPRCLEGDGPVAVLDVWRILDGRLGSGVRYIPLGRSFDDAAGEAHLARLWGSRTPQLAASKGSAGVTTPSTVSPLLEADAPS